MPLLNPDLIPTSSETTLLFALGRRRRKRRRRKCTAGTFVPALSTKQNSGKLMNCCLFPCYVTRKNPEGAAIQEAASEDEGQAQDPSDLNLS